jgi:hypothetical protein
MPLENDPHRSMTTGRERQNPPHTFTVSVRMRGRRRIGKRRDR